MDVIFPHGKDVQLCRPIRSQTPVLSVVEGPILSGDEGPILSGDEGLYPLSYGCVVERLYLFRGEKSRNASGAVLFRMYQMVPGAIPVQPKREKIR